MPVEEAHRASAFRLVRGASIALDREHAWLRLPSAPGDDARLIAQRLAGLPRVEIFLVAKGEGLVRGRLLGGEGDVASAAHDVPSAALPRSDELRIPWRSLAAWGTVAPLRATAQDAHVRRRETAWEPVPTGIVRGGATREPHALVVALSELLDWANFAPQRRLSPLSFVADGAMGLVLGTQLPPVRGTLLWRLPWGGGAGGALIPCGYRLEPEVPASVLRDALARSDAGDERPLLGAEDHVVFDEDGWTALPATAWVQLNRASLRQTLAESVRGSVETEEGGLS